MAKAATIPPPKPATRASIIQVAFICLALAALVFAVFAPTLHYPFINFDDQEYVFGHREITGGVTLPGIRWALTHTHGGNWHPLTSISHMLDCELFGLDAGRHHLMNVLLHAAATVVLFLAFQRMTGAIWSAAFVAALFSVHPLRVESVAWIAERKDVLSGLFFALTLLLYAGYVRKPTVARYVALFVIFCLGLMAKPMLVTVPFVLLLLDHWPLRRVESLQKLVPEKIPLLLASVGSAAATIMAQRSSLGSIDELPLFPRLGNALLSYVVYLRQTFWPTGLAIFYPHSADGREPIWLLALAALLLLAITAGALALRKTLACVFTGWFWFLIMLIPVLGIIQVGQQGHADRYTYLPQIGLLLALTGLINAAARKFHIGRSVIATAAFVILAASSWATIEQVGYWRNSELLWRHALAVTQNNDVAHANLADLLLQRGQIDEAIVHCEAALATRPRNADALNNLGLALWYKKQPIAAVSHYEASLAVRPHHLNAANNLAWILATFPDPVFRDGPRAVRLVEDVVRRSGQSNAMVLRTLAAAYAEAGRFPEAAETAEQALQLARSEKNTALESDLEMSLGRYHSGLPIRDSGAIGPSEVPRTLARPP